jgi:hypothetical protein
VPEENARAFNDYVASVIRDFKALGQTISAESKRAFLPWAQHASSVSAGTSVTFCLTFLCDKAHSRPYAKKGGDLLMHSIPLAPKAKLRPGYLIVGLALLLPAHPLLSQG